MQMLFCLMLYHKSLRPSLLFLFSFLLLCLDASLSSRLLIHSSASSNLLLYPSSVCFNCYCIHQFCDFYLLLSHIFYPFDEVVNVFIQSSPESCGVLECKHFWPPTPVIKGHPLCELFSSTCCESMLSLGHACCFSDTEEEHWGWGRGMPMALTKLCLYVTLGTPGHKPCWFPKLEILGALFLHYRSQRLGCPMWGTNPSFLRE